MAFLNHQQYEPPNWSFSTEARFPKLPSSLQGQLLECQAPGEFVNDKRSVKTGLKKNGCLVGGFNLFEKLSHYIGNIVFLTPDLVFLTPALFFDPWPCFFDPWHCFQGLFGSFSVVDCGRGNLRTVKKGK